MTDTPVFDLIARLETSNFELGKACEESAREIRRAITNMLKSQKYDGSSMVIRSLEKAAADNEAAVLACGGRQS